MGVFIIAMIIIIKHHECLVRASQRLTESIPRACTFVRMDRIYSNFAGEEKQAGVL